MKNKSSKKKRTWVIKIGSAIYIEGGPILLKSLMQQVHSLKTLYDINVVWVTSGAIASARSRTQRHWKKLPEKQALSAIGQPLLMDTYSLALNGLGLIAAQVLLTYNDIAKKDHAQNLKNTLETLIHWQVVPILNENDAVATEEIQFGDNDLLSAKVAGLIQAERLVILTNVDGLYDKNPSKHKNAALIPRLLRVTPKMLSSMDKQAISSLGRGGMYSKMRAAAFAQKQNVPTWVLRGDVAHSLVKLAQGESIGTHIGPELKKK